MSKQKIRVVVEMYGGTIQGVHTDSDVELDVVFLENPKYVDEDREFVVEEGNFKENVVFTHHDEIKAPTADIDPVFAAAQRRRSFRAGDEEKDDSTVSNP